MSARAYPLSQPESGSDPRFTFGLTLDVAKVIEAAGYPPVTDGSDFVDLQQALFRFLYESSVLGDIELDAARAVQDEDQPTSQPATPARGHGLDDFERHAMHADGTYAPRCGAENATGNIALFVYAVTCPRCLALLAEQAREEAFEESCRRCRTPFDPDDKRFDGQARSADSPWCRGCVDNCYEGDVGHRCVVCEVAS